MPPLTPSVFNEWDPLETAIAYDYCEDVAKCRAPGSAQEMGLLSALRANGVSVLTPDIPAERQRKHVFARDPVFTVGNDVFLAPMDNSRRGEEVFAEALLQQYEITPRMTTEHGGNILLLPGKKALIGYDAYKDDSSDEAFQETCDPQSHVLARLLEEARWKTMLVCHYEMHVDCCIAPLPDGSFLWHKDRLGSVAQYDLQREFGKGAFTNVTYALGGAPALNLLWVNPETVLAPENDAVHRLLADRRFKVWSVFGKIHEAGGSGRCAVAPLIRAA